MDRDPISWLEVHLGLNAEDAEAIFLATLWVDAARASARFGYAKDNDIPPALDVRMSDPGYVLDLLRALEDEPHPRAQEALRRWLRALP